MNGEQRQQGQTGQMLMPVIALIQHISQTFWLNPGDIVLTGTPEGVGALAEGDKLSMTLNGYPIGQTHVVLQSCASFIQGKSI